MKTVDVKRDFIKELSVINKNRFTLQQTKSLFLGLLFELISNRQIFDKNKDINEFIKEVFKKEYNDYVYRGRPYLASRVLKDISKEYDSLKVSASIKLIILYLEEKDGINNYKGRKTSSDLEDDVVGWFNSISKGKAKN
ncbi:hypothetical protein ACTWPF_12870 [Oceanobacillus sp. M65]|uniref:hypothetical protein n=1 Tax=Oceanobacillus sp. M65 TaxID=3457435 RepID=UPI003FCD779E